MTTLKVAGFIGQLGDLKPPHNTADENPRYLTLDKGEPGQEAVPVILVYLAAHGLDCYLWREVHANVTFNEGKDEPSIGVFAFDAASVLATTEPTEVIGVWSVED